MTGMSTGGFAGIDVDDFAGTDPILTIADEVFTAMIDGAPGFVQPWPTRDVPSLTDPVHAWVDVDGAMPGRVLLTTEHETATRISRALLMLGDDADVDEEDFRDAIGEVANVVGGNVKSLVPDPGALSLSGVSRQRPPTAGTLLHQLDLDWRGRLLVVSLWHLTG